jgi:DNA polymerase III sliding clamp (beta) subunit (PCNA family)
VLSDPNVAALIREIAPRLPEDDPDVLLETSRKNQEASLKLLEGIEKTQRPENLVEMRAMSEKILARVNEIEMNNLDPEIKSQASSVIGLKHFKTFIESVSQISETVNLKFDSDGIRAKASNPSANMMVEAFLPKSLFSRYVELGEIGLPNTKKLIGMLSVLSSGRISGKANLLFYVKQGTDSNPLQLHMISGQTDMDYLLQDPLSIEDQKFPQPISTCKVRIEGKNLAEAIKQSTNLSKTATSRISESAKFLVSKKFFRILTEDENHDNVTAKPKCEVLGDGSADSTFNIAELMVIYPTIGKSKDITLSLGMNQPMILDMTIDKMAIMYQIKEKEPKKDPKEEQGAN